MGDPIHLEKMGRELKCPICLSLLNCSVSLTCNHVFCNSCIMKSMKSGSNCPVCKVPYQRREVRPAPHMDNLVSIYKSMEAASGFQIFVTQNPPSAKLFDEEKQEEADTNCPRKSIQRTSQDNVEYQTTAKRKLSRKRVKPDQEVSDPIVAKPSFPTKKRVQVPQCFPSEAPTMPEKLQSDENIRNRFKNTSLFPKENPVPNETSEPVLSPFFWLRDEEDMEKSSQRTIGSQFLDISPPHVPTFSDIKDSDDEYPSKLSPAEEVCGKSNDADLFDSEMFEWTQRACSPELYSNRSSPAKMQDGNSSEIDGILDSRQNAPSLRSNANAQIIESEKCLNSEHREAPIDVESPLPSTLGHKITNSQVMSDKSNKRDRTAKKAILKRCANKDAEQDLKAPHNLKTKSKKTMQKQAREIKGDSLNFNKTRKSREKSGFGTSATELKNENVLPVPLRGEPLNLKDRMLDGELPSSLCKKQCDKEDHRGNSGKRRSSSTTLCPRDQPLRSKKRKLDSIINHIEDKNTQKPEDENTIPPKLDGKNISNIQQKRQIPGKEFSSALSSGSNKRLRQKKNMKVSFHGISEQGVLNDYQEEQNNIPTKETQFIEMVTDAFAKESQSTEKIQGSPDSRIINNSSMLGKLDQANGLALRSCQTFSQKIQCAFCHSSEDSEASGEMVCYHDGRPVAASNNGGSKVIYSHRNCAEWAPNVYFEYDTAINLEAELTRSKRIKCCCCGLKGAALGCYEKSCRRSFHVTCARMTPQCRWDAVHFVMLCPLHASSKLPSEDLEIQGRPRKNCIPKRQKCNQCDQVVFKPDVSTCPSWNSGVTTDKLVLCCSALTVEEREIVSEFQKLSGVNVSKSWHSSVTHVIASTDENGACRRTLKILMGILEGKWILNIDWVKACMKAMKPVQENQFEILVDIHGIRDGPQLGRLRILNKEPKIFEGLKFYLMGNFVASYKGYIQDLIVAGGGTVLHRKPLSETSGTLWPSTLIIYSIELPDKCDSKKDMILSRRRADAEALASATGAKAVNNSWVLNSIAACRLQNFTE